MLTFSSQTFAFLPIVENFSYLDYNAGPENWDAVENDQGEILFANQYGVLVYDGYNWEMIDLGGQFHVRCFFKDLESGRIYLAGDDIIGYLEFNALDEPIFTSMADQLPPGKRPSSIWQILRFRKDIIFQTSEELLIYSGNKIYSQPNNSFVRSMHLSNNRLFIFNNDYGLMEYDGVNLNKLPNTQILKGQEQIVVNSFKNGDLLICDNSALKFYRYDFNKMHECFQNQNTIVRKFVFCIKKYRNHFIFGTMNSGTFEVSETGELIENLNANKGLKGHKVFNVYSDSHKNLWICSEEGIDMVSTHIPLRMLNRVSGIEGNAHGFSIIEDDIYLLTSWGVYIAKVDAIKNFRQESVKFEIWNHTEHPSFFIKKIKNQLFIGDLFGLHIVSNGKRTHEIKRRLSRVMESVSKTNETYLVGFESGLSLVSINNNGMEEIAHFPDFPNIEKIFRVNNDFLITNTSKKTFLITLENGEIKEKFLPKDFEGDINRVFQHHNYIILSNENGTFMFDDSFKKVDVQSFGLDPRKTLEVFFEDTYNNIWVGTKSGRDQVFNHNFEILSKEKCEYEWIVKSCSKLLNDRIRFIKHIDRDIICLGGFSGFFLMNISSDVTLKTGGKLEYSKVHLTDERGDVQFRLNHEGIFSPEDTTLNSFSISNIPAEFTNIYIEVNNNSFLHSTNNEFKYSLQGPINQIIDYTIDQGHNFTNLIPGKYIVSVSMKDAFGQEIQSQQLHFIIKENWFKTPLFLIAIVLGIILFVAAIFFFQKKIHSVIRQGLEIEVQEKNKAIDDNNQYLRDSISFAKVIQEAHLPSKSVFKPAFEHSFILNKPKDLVGGDFYWADYSYPQLILVVADCTGHGVAGGFMTMLAINRLHAIIKEEQFLAPKDILKKLNRLIINALDRKSDEYSFADGMDLAVINVDTQYQTLTFAGSKRSILVQDEDGVKEIKGNNKSLGTISNDGRYSEYIIKLRKGQRIYLMTDGVTDQFGGIDDKKLGVNRLKTFLESTYTHNFSQQQKELEDFIQGWKGNQMQIDDMLFIGLEV